jgi:organic radical activating enzyme
MKQHDWTPPNYKIIHHADETNRLLEEIKAQVCHIDLAYFAGGEPLITDEHYQILEEMIRTGRNREITLRYNTNMSNFKYKKYDILDLWSRFKRVEISASIDHYGSRAEYIRHGTDWAVVEANLKSIRDLDFIDYQFNCVLSIFNYATMTEFFEYMMSNDLLRRKDMISIYRALTPHYYCAHGLPESVKDIANTNMRQLHKYMIDKDWYQAMHINDAINFTNEKHTWNEIKTEFQHHTQRRDEIRNENFCETFPELQELMND